MTTGSDQVGPLEVAQARLNDRIEDTMEQLSVHDAGGYVEADPAEGAWLSIQQVRLGDREEAHLDSLRQFRWHLSLVRAAAQQAPLPARERGATDS